jgi:hypothetical protein
MTENNKVEEKKTPFYLNVFYGMREMINLMVPLLWVTSIWSYLGNVIKYGAVFYAYETTETVTQTHYAKSALTMIFALTMWTHTMYFERIKTLREDFNNYMEYLFTKEKSP